VTSTAARATSNTEMVATRATESRARVAGAAATSTMRAGWLAACPAGCDAAGADRTPGSVTVVRAMGAGALFDSGRVDGCAAGCTDCTGAGPCAEAADRGAADADRDLHADGDAEPPDGVPWPCPLG